MIEHDDFLSDLSVRLYLRGDVFRHHQDVFLARHGADVRGTVVEVGAEPGYGLARHFPGADRYVSTNLVGGVDARLDLTALGLADGAVDTLVCVSVLEHVDDLDAAVDELARVLAPGGRLLLTVPFLYPVHDTHDVWRVTPTALGAMLARRGLRVDTLVGLGGRLATLAALLQRPRGVWSPRYAPQKLAGLALVALLGRRDQPDDSPLGTGIRATRPA